MQGFPNSDKGWEGGKFFPVRGWGDFLSGEGNLRRSDFDDSKLFHS